MKNQIQVFRTVEIDGQPWWVLKDVCKALALKNVTETSRRLDDDERCSVRLNTLGGNQSMTVISESGLYAVILRSDKQNARAFRKWVTSEVLPAIRKTGAYVTDELREKLTESEEERSRFVEALVNERNARKSVERKNVILREEFARVLMECDRLRGENASLQNERDVLDEFADELLPSAAYCDTILQCKNALPISIIAGSYGMSAVVFNRLLRELKIQRKVRGVWILYSKYKSNGYTALRTCSAGGERSVTFTCWTQRGRKFIYDTLKQHGLVPQIEKMYENFI